MHQESHSDLPRAFTARPPLDRETEAALARRYAATGDPQAFRLLVESNLRLVVKMATEYTTPERSEFPDLVQEGSLGLVEGVRRYDPARGTRLSTYAGFWVRAFIIRHIMDSLRLVRLGRGRADRQAFFRGELPPSELSLEAPRASSPEGEPLFASLPDPTAVPADAALVRQQTGAIVAEEARAFERSLDERSSVVFRQRLLALRPPPLRHLARRFSLSGERVRQIEKDLAARFRARVAPLIDEPAA